MRAKHYITFIALLLAVFFVGINAVHAETIYRFGASVTVNPDSSVKVTELIVYDFGSSERHGIFRDIPVQYARDAGVYSIELSDINVTDENGEPYAFTVSEKGANKEIRIGDADTTVTGQRAYLITYTVHGAINYFVDHDELYWNVTGNDWEVPMGSASAKAIYPETNSATSTCFRGAVGATNPCMIKQENTTSTFYFAGGLQPGEGLTFALSLPKGLLQKPSPLQAPMTNAKNALMENAAWFLPILTFLYMFHHWYENGRDESGKGTIVPQYEPPEGVTPAGAGFLVNDRTSDGDISAEIIELARRGYILITQHEKDAGIFSGGNSYSLTRLKPKDDIPDSFERDLMAHLFAGKPGEERPTIELSELKNKFYADMKILKKNLGEQLATQGYYKKNPESVRGRYAGIGMGIIIIGAFVPFFMNVISGSTFGAILISGFIILASGGFMIQRTKQGALTREYLLGLKDYIGTAEADRIKFHNAPEKNPERFEKLLPYAMIFGLEKEWAKQFEGIYTEPPRWYAGSAYAHGFNAGLFAGSMRDFSKVSAATLVSTPGGKGGSGFGGGGFSGGGMGGGGGGSW